MLTPLTDTFEIRFNLAFELQSIASRAACERILNDIATKLLLSTFIACDCERGVSCDAQCLTCSLDPWLSSPFPFFSILMLMSTARTTFEVDTAPLSLEYATIALVAAGAFHAQGRARSS